MADKWRELVLTALTDFLGRRGLHSATDPSPEPSIEEFVGRVVTKPGRSNHGIMCPRIGGRLGRNPRVDVSRAQRINGGKEMHQLRLRTLDGSQARWLPMRAYISILYCTILFVT